MSTALALALEEFRKVWKNFPVQHMMLFLEVARNDIEKKEWGVVELGERLDMPQATVSRSLSDISAGSVKETGDGGKEVIDLVTTRADRADHRKRIPTLTKRGQLFYDKISRILEVGK